MHCKVEKIVVDQMSLVPITLSSDELCSVDIAPLHIFRMINLSFRELNLKDVDLDDVLIHLHNLGVGQQLDTIRYSGRRIYQYNDDDIMNIYIYIVSHLPLWLLLI